MGLKQFAGERSSEKTFIVSSGRLLQFARSIGSTLSTVDSTQELPTFFTIFRDGEFELLKRMGVSLSRVLHGEQEYAIGAPMVVGDQISYLTTLVSVHEKKGKSSNLHILNLQTEFNVYKSDKKIGSAKTVLVIKEKT